MTKKKTESKPVESDGITEPDITRHDETYHPMAVEEPTALDRLEALELRMAVMEKTVSQHNDYHFSGISKIGGVT